MTTTHQSQPAREIGPYRIEEKLGTGGMGTVYRAYHRRLARPVALKQIRPGLAHRKSIRKQFLREARAAARLSHPNIVQVYDIIEDDSGDWMVMELAGGMELQRLIEAGPLEVSRVLALGRDLAKGLAAAHAQGIVHRDLKAENVIVTPAGQAKILDFGIAKLLDSTTDASSVEGRVIGTPRIMSPEQAQGLKVDHRSDLFSLGVLLYEALTARSPFRDLRKTIQGTLERVCSHRQTPVHERDSRIPRELSDLVDRLLEKQPEARPQSAEDVVLDLQRIGGAQEQTIKVLFVDDEPDLEMLIKQLYRKKLRRKKLFFDFAGDGLEAIEKLRQDEDITVVMSDINMPKMDGLTLLDEIGKLDRRLLTVIVSAYGDMENIRAAMNRGAFDFLVKPIDFEDLELTRKKAMTEAVEIREQQQLQEENRLLDERNRFIRAAFSNYLTPNASAADSGPEGGKVEATLLKARIAGLDSLEQGADFFNAWSRFLDQVTRIVIQHGGTLVKLKKDTIVIAFGLLSSMKDDPQRAADCALALREAAQSLSARIEGSGLELEVGVKSGRIALGGHPGQTGS